MLAYIRFRPVSGFVAAATLALAALLGFAAGWLANAQEPLRPITPLLSSSETVVGEAISYPLGSPARISAAVVALAPGGETGWHGHGVPVFGYVLEGELTVDYREKGERVYRAGDAVLEAMSVEHNGRNTGSGTMRILAVFMGAEGLKTSIPSRAPGTGQ